MAIQFHCKSCQQLLSIAGRKTGTDVDCPRCGKMQTVPSQEAAEAAMAMTRSRQLGEIDPAAADSPFVIHDSPETGELDAGQPDPAMPLVDNRPPPVGMVLLNRQTLVLASILLTVLPVAGVALGYFFGRCDSLRPAEGGGLESSAEEVLMQGKIVWEEATADNSGRIMGDEGAVIIVLPSEVFPESTLSIQDLRPQDPHPASNNQSLKQIDELGGLYARADASGLFPLVFPDSGKYRVLLISRNTARPLDTPIDENDLEEIEKYFMHAEDLIGRHRYRWSTEEISRETPPIEHGFGPSG